MQPKGCEKCGLTKDNHTALSPAYDLVSSRLVIPEEREELALTLNGRQNRLTREDFLAFATYLDIAPDYAEKKIAQLRDLLLPAFQYRPCLYTQERL